MFMVFFHSIFAELSKLAFCHKKSLPTCKFVVLAVFFIVLLGTRISFSPSSFSNTVVPNMNRIILLQVIILK